MGVISSCCKSEEKFSSSGTSIKDDDDEDDGFMETPIKPNSQKHTAVGSAPPSTTKLDRLGDRTRMSAGVMQEINTILLQFATDPVFQRHLTRPAVQEGEHTIPYPLPSFDTIPNLTPPPTSLPYTTIKSI